MPRKGKKILGALKGAVKFTRKVAANPLVRTLANEGIKRLPPKARQAVSKASNLVRNARPIVRTVMQTLPSSVGNVIISNNDSVTEEKFEWDLITGVYIPNSGAPYNGHLNIPLTPYKSFTSSEAGGVATTSWDRILESYYPRFTHYRVKKVELVYSGTAPTNATIGQSTGSVYFACSQDPTMNAPETSEYSMMEKSVKAPIYGSGATLTANMDKKDWFSLDPTKTYSQIAGTSTDRKVFWAGIAFIAFSELSVPTVSVRMRTTFEFKGRNPAYEAGSTDLYFMGTNNPQTTPLNGTLHPSQGSSPPQVTVNSSNEICRPISAGYRLLKFLNFTSNASPGGSGPQVDIQNPLGTSVFTSRELFRIYTNGTTSSSIVDYQNSSNTITSLTTEAAEITFALILVHAKPGDILVTAPSPVTSDQSNLDLVIVDEMRINDTMASAIYQKYNPGVALPV